VRFESISIKNFRNFDEVTVSLANKNVFFGLNDVGKTNFLYALRFVFDRDVRRLNFMDSDYHNKRTTMPIEILVTLDISDSDSADSQKLRAQLKGALRSGQDKVYIKLVAEYSTGELSGIPLLYWGGDPDKLCEMKQRGNLYDIDYVFNVFYIDSYVDLQALFHKNATALVKNEGKEDQGILQAIQDTVQDLNAHIASLSGIRNFESRITPEYKKFKNENVSISVKSEVGVKNFYANVVPYIRRDDDDNLYPTAGEGRKKLLAYSIYDLLSTESAEKKINLFLVEEPETHLHKSMQIALSRILFSDEKYGYLFVSTHSPFVLYEMDSVNLVRVFNKTKINGASTFYKVPEGFATMRKMLNRRLAEAIFADKVLLVEGESECLLFEKVYSVVNPSYEIDGMCILDVGGVGFQPYHDILDGLDISSVVKTDNDLRAVKSGGFSVLGFSRINKIIGQDILPTARVVLGDVAAKRQLYDANRSMLDQIRKDYSLFLSRCDLENDLFEVIGGKLDLPCENSVAWLQEKKQQHMVELIHYLTDEICRQIYNHYNFACLKAVDE